MFFFIILLSTSKPRQIGVLLLASKFFSSIVRFPVFVEALGFSNTLIGLVFWIWIGFKDYWIVIFYILKVYCIRSRHILLAI